VSKKEFLAHYEFGNNQKRSKIVKNFPSPFISLNFHQKCRAKLSTFSTKIQSHISSHPIIHQFSCSKWNRQSQKSFPDQKFFCLPQNLLCLFFGGIPQRPMMMMMSSPPSFGWPMSTLCPHNLIQFGVAHCPFCLAKCMPTFPPLSSLFAPAFPLASVHPHHSLLIGQGSQKRKNAKMRRKGEIEPPPPFRLYSTHSARGQNVGPRGCQMGSLAYSTHRAV
jgi:hypothetical protein